ncbi:DUF2378 family protein [Vitiosangium sp. GDMCC 1.1324]|uniref:DUF2378 family protein n=1 Tax=Vitiosangium sp. (strain GDMCC 1.1324) TaxID=2138576 RepID=UPI000D36BBDA|nr:DUF2378 family protein [Vitiosangium sp. GDMCC 1.1324]PTL77790.1 TIGR02265 family protein [Vitiosangium sp. GDMCC 1.1324]
MQHSFSGRATQGSFFEGLFIRSLKAGGAFADSLKACGYDLREPKALYPIEVWNAALEVAWRHCYPGWDRESAYRELGLQLCAGFLQTWMGKVVDMSLPMLGPDRLIARIPNLLALDTFRYDVRVLPLGWRQYRVSIRNDPDAKPDLIAGLLEGGLRRTGVNPTVTVTLRSGRDFDVDVSW